MAYKKKFKRKMKPRRPILLDHRYPIGHTTGLTDKEWAEFAKNYSPKTPEENKELM